MRNRIRRLFRKSAPHRAGYTRTLLPPCTRYTGYPQAPGVTVSEIEAHFRVCRTLGEPV